MVTRTFIIPICWVLPVAASFARDCAALPVPVAVAANASAAIATRAVTVAKNLRDIVPPFLVCVRPRYPIENTENLV